MCSPEPVRSFVDDIWVLLGFRALIGVSVGMIMPLSTGLLAIPISRRRNRLA
jgi:hypothetical protein